MDIILSLVPESWVTGKASEGPSIRGKGFRRPVDPTKTRPSKHATLRFWRCRRRHKGKRQAQDGIGYEWCCFELLLCFRWCDRRYCAQLWGWDGWPYPGLRFKHEQHWSDSRRNLHACEFLFGLHLVFIWFSCMWVSFWFSCMWVSPSLNFSTVEFSHFESPKGAFWFSSYLFGFHLVFILPFWFSSYHRWVFLFSRWRQWIS